jgi:hypothetical protein
MFDQRIALIAIVAFAAWLLIGLPLIYLPSARTNELVAAAPKVAPVMTALVALAALLVASRQLRLNRLNQRETTAKSIFREFLNLCIEYPDLARGRPTDANKARYDWFVHQFLWAAEEFLEFDDSDWRDNLRLHVAYHEHFLRTDQEFLSKDLQTYKPKLRSFLKWALDSLPASNGPAASGQPKPR